MMHHDEAGFDDFCCCHSVDLVDPGYGCGCDFDCYHDVGPSMLMNVTTEIQQKKKTTTTTTA